MPIVTVPGQGDVSFPEGMSSDQMAAAIKQNFPDVGKAPAATKPNTTGPAASQDDLEEMRRTDPEGAANLEAQGYKPTDKPNPPPAKYAPEEVYISPDLPLNDKLKALGDTGIDINLAQQSSNFNPKAIQDQYKNKDSGFSDAVATSLGQSVPFVGDQAESAVRGATRFVGDVGTMIANHTYRSPADIEYAKLQDAINRNIKEQLINKGSNLDDYGNYKTPTLEKIGYGAGALGAGIATGGAADAALPAVAARGLVGAGLNTARGAAIGAVSGAASEPTDPVGGAKSGAVFGGALSAAGQGVGAGVRKLSENSPEVMQDIANTSDALIDKMGGVKGAGTAEVMGRPNLTGERSVSNMQNINIPSWIPGGNLVKKATGFLTGAEKSQSEKLVGTEAAANNANLALDTDEGWVNTLAKEPALQTQQAKLDMHDPSKFAEYYPQLSDEGKFAAVSGMVSNAYKTALQAGKNGVLDMPTLNQKLKDIINVTGDTSYVRGQQKWSLQGLQKLTEMASSNVSRDQLVNAINNIGPKGPGAAMGAAAIGLIDDVMGVGSHVAGHALQAPLIYNIGNRILDNKAVRNGLIDLAAAKNPNQTVRAMAAIKGAMDQPTNGE